MNPESFNRLRNPSQADFDAFVAWLTQNACSELRGARGNPEATRSAFIRYFQRGLRADLLLDELLQVLLSRPSACTSPFARAGFPPTEARNLIEMVKGLTLEEIGAFTK